MNNLPNAAPSSNAEAANSAPTGWENMTGEQPATTPETPQANITPEGVQAQAAPESNPAEAAPAASTEQTPADTLGQTQPETIITEEAVLDTPAGETNAASIETIEPMPAAQPAEQLGTINPPSENNVQLAEPAVNIPTPAVAPETPVLETAESTIIETPQTEAVASETTVESIDNSASEQSETSAQEVRNDAVGSQDQLPGTSPVETPATPEIATSTAEAPAQPETPTTERPIIPETPEVAA